MQSISPQSRRQEYSSWHCALARSAACLRTIVYRLRGHKRRRTIAQRRSSRSDFAHLVCRRRDLGTRGHNKAQPQSPQQQSGNPLRSHAWPRASCAAITLRFATARLPSQWDANFRLTHEDSPAEGKASVRQHWASPCSCPLEPVPPSASRRGQGAWVKARLRPLCRQGAVRRCWPLHRRGSAQETGCRHRFHCPCRLRLRQLPHAVSRGRAPRARGAVGGDYRG
mmetsp:Transcript_53929/g.115829  ORF Transcript_53929/g.115829 Transcript_53929/m.115829 type:complete len:225 (-) Transcript_53929:60-734(-)